jgi:flagellin
MVKGHPGSEDQNCSHNGKLKEKESPMPVIATNTSANSAIVYLNNNSRAQEMSLNKLSSGSRIVRASDDAAGLAVASRLQGNITALRQASTNTVQARSVLQTADGALSRVGDILQRMKALATQSNSGSVDATARGFINTEYQQLLTEIGSTATSTTFNNVALITGTYNLNYQAGILATDIIAVDLSTVNATVAGLGLNGSNVSTQALAVTANGALDTAINNISTYRATVGALISRFDYRSDNIDTMRNNLEAARSVIMDVDIAAEQTNLTSKRVLTESAIAALAQANQVKQSLLSLVR